MKKVSIIFLTVLAIAGVWFLWRLQPWMPAGRAVALGKWQIGEFEFQAWQRKTPSLFKPFADGLFVRRGTSAWTVVNIETQGYYEPKIALQQEDSEVAVYRDGERRGRYDMTTQTFSANGQLVTPVYIDLEPPGDWWVKK